MRTPPCRNEENFCQSIISAQIISFNFHSSMLFLFSMKKRSDLGNSWDNFFSAAKRKFWRLKGKNHREKNCKAKPHLLVGDSTPSLFSSHRLFSSSSRQFKLQCCKIDGRVVSERRRRSARRRAEKKNVKFIMKRRRKKIIFNESNSSASENNIHKASHSRRRAACERWNHTRRCLGKRKRATAKSRFFSRCSSVFFFANVRSNQSPTIWP